jgi:type IX secretion system PorP/SprF family membrane protein
MMNLKRTYYLIVILLFSITAYSQQTGLSMHFMHEPMIYNPASAGKFLPLNAFIMNRSQWARVEGKPLTQLLGASMGFDNNNHGVGMILFNDVIGPMNNTGAKLNYAFHIPMESSVLSLGIAGHIYQFNVNRANIDLEDPTDQVFVDLESKMNADASFGISYYNTVLDISIAFPNLIANKVGWVDNNDTIGYYKNKRQLYIAATYKLKVNEEVSINTGAMASYTNNEPLQIQANAIAMIRDMFWMGLNFKNDISSGFMFGLKLNNKYTLGYSFDIPLTPNRHYFSGSHEFYINIGLFNSRKYEVNLKNDDLRF